jgi:hypothetical protein
MLSRVLGEHTTEALPARPAALEPFVPDGTIRASDEDIDPPVRPGDRRR